MKREESRDVEEPRDPARVPGERRDEAGPDVTSGKADEGAGWLESGAEDPAFFIKPSDGE